MSSAINTLADCLLAVLLVATIASCVALSRRITRLKSDESAMRKTVGELMLATETAERAIAGLRTTLGDCDRTLADRLRTAERYSACPTLENWCNPLVSPRYLSSGVA
jgi:hypothetical protein